MKIKIELEVGGKKFQMSLEEVEELYRVLDQLAGNKKVTYVPQYPVYPYYPIDTVPWTYTYGGTSIKVGGSISEAYDAESDYAIKEEESSHHA